VLLSKIANHAQLRIGLRATGAESAQLLFSSTDALAGPSISFRATPDTATPRLTILPFSHTPAGDPITAFNLRDYTVVAKGPPPGPVTDLDVGGFPARRAYLRFDIPKRIIDSTSVVRATLLLNQIPNNALDPNDSIAVLPHLVLAANAVTDPTKASQVIAEIAVDTVYMKPGASGIQLVELARAFTFWRTQDPEKSPRAIVLRSLSEGRSPLEFRFSSSEAPAALRPRLRISYTTRVPLGLP
jgi:hypothetical protein